MVAREKIPCIPTKAFQHPSFGFEMSFLLPLAVHWPEEIFESHLFLFLGI